MTTTFEVIGVRPLLRHTLPTLAFAVRAIELAEPFPRAIHTIALRIEILIDAPSRLRDDGTRARLVELRAERERRAPVQRLPWRRVDTLVPSFTGSTTFLVPVICDFAHVDGELFRGPADGAVPLAFLFSGTVFYEEGEGHPEVEHVPHGTHASFRLPLRVWRELMDHYEPSGTWIRLSHRTLDLLRAHCGASGALSYDAAIAKLLERPEQRRLRVRT
jgi:hypothetical protein